MNKIVIFGTGDIAEIVNFYFSHDTQYKIAAFTADEEYIKNDTFLGLPVIPFANVESTYPPTKFDMFVALSYTGVNKVRAKKYYEAKNKGYKLITYICSRSVFWGDTQVGDNCFILENQTIQPFVKIGNNVTIWSGNHIGHHSTIGDHCFVSSHVVISGHVNIEPYCFLGVNCTIRNGIKVARECVIGAGTTILDDTIEKGVYKNNTSTFYIDDSSNLKKI
jgi:sugar O-acyltransferase (sialic acid O-acetyltransferase NeuD family)